ncbi:hypothetical protein CRE_23119 [Caenorhabditis remanei]|uniref:Uncharacterized protein n=1 Tax=Caenorhabditis remanei TaxID=31234 RepID=E3ND13_CAERE|nr:hypothetical protein CRE_23119 [Caenorhabditis remanei]
MNRKLVRAQPNDIPELASYSNSPETSDDDEICVVYARIQQVEIERDAEIGT